MKNIAILGSTGSIGTQTLDIIESHPNLFKASVLTAHKNWELLALQAKKFNPEYVVIAEESCYQPLKEALRHTSIHVEFGDMAISDVVSIPEVDMVVTAMVGYSGLLPTVNAIKAGKTIALANKETLVVAGELISELLKQNNVAILPVDSEHSAIFQCLVGENRKNLHKILLTASGGPFRTWKIEDMKNITVKDALNHPNWSMGAKVTIDSASMMNKGFEMIEAKWLFNCNPSDIEILVHPQSIVHSMVEFCDGSVKAQLGVPDMRLPIQYALTYPNRLPSIVDSLNWREVSNLTFEKPDLNKFPMLRLAFSAIEKGGNMPCILNAANEIAVQSFLSNKIPFIMIEKVAESTMENIHFIKHPQLEDLIETNKIARKFAEEWVSTHYN